MRDRTPTVIVGLLFLLFCVVVECLWTLWGGGK